MFHQLKILNMNICIILSGQSSTIKGVAEIEGFDCGAPFFGGNWAIRVSRFFSVGYKTENDFFAECSFIREML